VKRWWTAGHGEMTVCEIDLRVSGHWRYGLRATMAPRQGFTVSSTRSSPMSGSSEPKSSRPSRTPSPFDTVTFCEPTAGRTVLTILIQHASQANRDVYLRDSTGLQEAMNLFEHVVLELR
jgi:uncharacterized protein YndB with AHSA1/START domain